MNKGDSLEITQLLNSLSDGNQLALGELMPLVYDELHRLAKMHMNRQRKNHTFQTTELINEAFLRLSKNEKQSWKNRSHFFGVAAQAMRHILVDYARQKHSQKRGGKEALQITLKENAAISFGQSDEIIALDEALTNLGKHDERKMRVVELKFFGGLKVDEIAEALNVSKVTINNDWRFAKMWLLRELSNN